MPDNGLAKILKAPQNWRKYLSNIDVLHLVCTWSDLSTVRTIFHYALHYWVYSDLVTV